MDIIQTFETTISDNDGKYGVACLTVPARSIPEDKRERPIDELLHGLEFTKSTAIPPSLLPHPIASLIAAAAPERQENPIQIYERLVQNPSQALIDDLVGLETFSFAEQISSSALIPFEQSPIDLAALGTVFAEAGRAGLGAYAGWVIAEPTPLLFLTVPAGMIVFGAAAGLAIGLEEGLKGRIIEWLARIFTPPPPLPEPEPSPGILERRKDVLVGSVRIRKREGP